MFSFRQGRRVAPIRSPEGRRYAEEVVGTLVAIVALRAALEGALTGRFHNSQGERVALTTRALRAFLVGCP